MARIWYSWNPNYPTGNQPKISESVSKKEPNAGLFLQDFYYLEWIWYLTVILVVSSCIQAISILCDFVQFTELQNYWLTNLLNYKMAYQGSPSHDIEIADNDPNKV